MKLGTAPRHPNYNFLYLLDVFAVYFVLKYVRGTSVLFRLVHISYLFKSRHGILVLHFILSVLHPGCFPPFNICAPERSNYYSCFSFKFPALLSLPSVALLSSELFLVPLKNSLGSVKNN